LLSDWTRLDALEKANEREVAGLVAQALAEAESPMGQETAA
jgi:hypothetical protein